MSRRRVGMRLDTGHWESKNYRQRVTSRVWKKILDRDETQIYVDGMIVNLKGKVMDDGSVEIYREGQDGSDKEV